MGTESIDKIIGANLRKIRELRDDKQNDAAEYLGVSTSTYGRIERGELPITPKRLQDLQKRWNVNRATLFHGVDAGPEGYANLIERQQLRKSIQDRIEHVDDINILRTMDQILDLSDAKKRGSR